MRKIELILSRWFAVELQVGFEVEGYNQGIVLVDGGALSSRTLVMVPFLKALVGRFSLVEVTIAETVCDGRCLEVVV